MFKIVGSLPVKTRLPFKAWVLGNGALLIGGGPNQSVRGALVPRPSSRLIIE
jgi:hypothetical protein